MQTAVKLDPHETKQIRSVTRHRSRSELLMLATNRFCDTDTHDRLSIEQYKEAFYLLIGEADFPTKQIVARTLANCLAAPRPIVLFFALEQIEIAQPILTHSMAIGQLDMLRVIEMKGVDYARHIATRPDIGPSVVKRLRELNDASVDEVLDRNGALVGSTTLPSADELFRQILARNRKGEAEPTVSVATEEAIDSNVDAAPQIVANNQYQETSDVAGEMQDDSVDVMTGKLNSASQALVAAAARGGRLQQSGSPAKPSPVQAFDFGEAFEKASRSRSHQAMAALMQKRFGVSFETAFQVLADKSGDTLAVLLRAADVSAAQANRIQLLTHPTIGLSVHNAMRAVRFYEKLKQESCLEAVSQWPRETNSTVHHQPYLEEGKPVRVRNASALSNGVAQAQTNREDFRKAG